MSIKEHLHEQRHKFSLLNNLVSLIVHAMPRNKGHTRVLWHLLPQVNGTLVGTDGC